MKGLFFVTHLLGTGHLSRVLTLARAFEAQGHDAMVVSGGLPAPHLEMGDVNLMQLPPVTSNGVDFSTLLTDQGEIANEAYLAERRQTATDTLTRFAPDAVITELYPFGRKSLQAEFTAILTAARNLPKTPVILSSIRDILAPPRKPKKAERAEAAIAEFYDGVLVHSDGEVIPLDVSWPVTPALAEKLLYTGFVTSPLPEPAASLPKNEILVSAGGGSVGAHVFDAALQAAHHSDFTWRLLVGGAHRDMRITELQARAPDNAIVEAVRPDFRQLLQTAACSISLCGYNTALDVLQARCPAIFVPFDEGVEVEQSLRANSLAKHPALSVIAARDLTPDRLLEQINTVMTAPKIKTGRTAMNGAQQSVEITRRLVQGIRHV